MNRLTKHVKCANGSFEIGSTHNNGIDYYNAHGRCNIYNGPKNLDQK